MVVKSLEYFDILSDLLVRAGFVFQMGASYIYQIVHKVLKVSLYLPFAKKYLATIIFKINLIFEGS